MKDFPIYLKKLMIHFSYILCYLLQNKINKKCKQIHKKAILWKSGVIRVPMAQKNRLVWIPPQSTSKKSKEILTNHIIARGTNPS